MATLYIIHGFLGAGKSTYSIKLAQQIEAERLNADEWCDENFPKERLEKDWDGCFAEAVEKLWQKAEALIGEGKDVILDIGFWSKSSRNHARQKAKDLRAEFQHHYVCAPDEVLLERIAQRSGSIAEKNLKDFHILKCYFEPPSADEGAVFIDNG